MTTSDDNRKLIEPLESVTAFFGALMLIAVTVGLAFLAFGSGPFGGYPRNVCAIQPDTTYGGDWKTTLVAARHGSSVNINGSAVLCTSHLTLAQHVLYALDELPAVVFWCGVLLLLWRIIRTARRTGPFTARVAAAMRRLGWFVLVGSVAAAVVHLLALDLLLLTMASLPNPFIDLIVMPVHLPVPILTGAALLTFARIIRAAAVMDDEIRATV
jgi:hypothetical protein